jgi:serine/threonine-protein kinase
MLGDERWLALAEQAAWDVYATPNRIAHLCCGLAGQAWALVDLYRHTGEPRWLTAATEMGTRAATALATPQPGMLIPGSLHKGDVGVAALAADLADPEAAAMPLFGSDI